MGKDQNVIEINGKKYDAVSGKPIASVSAKSKTRPVDGVSKPTAKKKKVAARSTSHTKRKTQKSKTLIRKAVKKPSASATKSKPTRVAGIAKPTLKVTRRRKHAAASAKKSDMISHFGSDASRSSVVKKVQKMPVKKQKVNKKVQTTHTAPAIRESETAVDRAAGASKVVEQALARATAHEHPHHPHDAKKKRRRRVSHKFGISARAMAISSTVLAGVLLGGFFAVQNVPNLSMRVAAARAGFNASLPGYAPSGFSFSGPINYSPGEVSVSYSSNTDDRTYNLTQRASNWNSEALLSNFVTADGKPYQTYLDRGRTLYIYDGSNATWVDNGVWYTVEGQSRLSSDQLVRIAASL